MSVTVSDVELYIKQTFTCDGVAVQGVGNTSIDIIVSNPSANLTYIFSCLENSFGAVVTRNGKGDGAFKVTLPDKIMDDRALQSDKTPTQKSYLSILVLASLLLVVLGMVAKVVYVNWDLLAEDFSKDKIQDNTDL